MAKQLHIFDKISPSSDSLVPKATEWRLFVDGASRNNPGPSGAGIYLEKQGVLVTKNGYYLGIRTNNQAEYLALLLGLFMLIDHVNKEDTVYIISDSQLLVRQINGIYKIKEPTLQVLHRLCTTKINDINATVEHVLRNENIEADKMANYGIDCKVIPPKRFIVLLKKYGIVL